MVMMLLSRRASFAALTLIFMGSTLLLVAPASWSQNTTNNPPPANTQNPINKDKPLIFDKVLSEQATQMVATLIQKNKLPANAVKETRVIDEEVWNAYTDGQNIFFTKPLWIALKTQDQRAFVLSHEVSHILLGHIPKSMARRLALGVLGRVFLNKYAQNNANLQRLEGLTLNTIDMKFSRNMELGADERGVQLMSNAGFNPKGAIEAFEILETQSQGGPPEFFRSHPLSKSRIEALSKKYKIGTPVVTPTSQPTPASTNPVQK
jgi:predicted Zn-dependent protease